MKKLYEEISAIKTLIDARKNLVELVNKFAGALQKESVVLTNEILTGFINQGAAYLSRIIVEASVAQFAKAGINVGAAVRAGIEGDAGEIAMTFDKYRGSIQSALKSAGIGPQDVTVKDGESLFSKKEENEIRECFSYYLREDEEGLYSAIERFCEQYNELSRLMEKEGFIPPADNLEAIFTQGSLSPIQHAPGSRELRPDTYLYLNDKGSLHPNPAWFGREKKLEYLFESR